MENERRRNYERKDSLNLIDYVVLGEKGEPVTRRMGRTLNVSEGGILLETHIALKEGRRVELTIALEEDMVELKGHVRHVKPSLEKGYCSGIQFIEMDEEGKRVLIRYVEALKTAKAV